MAIIPSYDLCRELTLYSVSTIASYIKEATNHGVGGHLSCGVQFSVLLNKTFLPSLRPAKSCLPVRKTPQMPISSIMTCTTLSTSVLHLIGPSTVKASGEMSAQWGLLFP